MADQQNKQTPTQEQNLKGKKVAILVTDGFEQVELTEPRKALDAAGAQTSIVSPKEDKVRGWNFTDWGEELKVDVPLAQAKADEFAALLLPGGVMNPDTLRMDDKAVDFVARLKCGNPSEPDTAIGPLINRQQLQRLLERIEQARAAGARQILGGAPEALVLPPHVFHRRDQ